ncbi:MAG: serine hydrolase [Bdellovibrionales bacterium]
MVGRILSRFFIIFVVALNINNAWAYMPSHPAGDPNFTVLPSGQDLKKMKVSGVSLYLAKGKGTAFTSTQQASYEKIRSESKTKANYPVQWVLMDLDNHRVLDRSAESNRKIFGASVSKIYVAATLLDKQAGKLSESQMQLMSNMLVVSSNTAWTNLQQQIGNGNSNLGRETIHKFTQRMDYKRTRGFQGYWGNIHGNELTAAELAEFLYDTYKDQYPGAETVWKIMHTYRTGSNRAHKYIPSSVYIGGKTGTYDGPTVDPETGSSKRSDGSAYTVRVRNQVIAFNLNGKEYGLSILADTGSDESAAALAGGLIRSLVKSRFR